MIKKTLRPCDCKDKNDVNSLDTSGIVYNGNSLKVKPNLVILTMGHTEIKIPMRQFKNFAEWYLEEQEVESYFTQDNDTTSD